MTLSKVVTVNMSDLIDTLVQVRGANFVTFEAATDPFHGKLPKTAPESLHGVQKYAKINALVNFYYEPAVLRRLLKEGKDESYFRKGTTWHQPIVHDDGVLTPLCWHYDKNRRRRLYLRVMVLGEIGEAVYKSPAGVIINRADILPYLPPARTYPNQGLDEPVRVKTYAVENLKNLTVETVIYKIE